MTKKANKLILCLLLISPLTVFAQLDTATQMVINPGFASNSANVFHQVQQQNDDYVKQEEARIRRESEEQVQQATVRAQAQARQAEAHLSSREAVPVRTRPLTKAELKDREDRQREEDEFRHRSYCKSMQRIAGDYSDLKRQRARQVLQIRWDTVLFDLTVAPLTGLYSDKALYDSDHLRKMANFGGVQDEDVRDDLNSLVKTFGSNHNSDEVRTAITVILNQNLPVTLQRIDFFLRAVEQVRLFEAYQNLIQLKRQQKAAYNYWIYDCHTDETNQLKTSLDNNEDQSEYDLTRQFALMYSTYEELHPDLDDFITPE